MGELIGEGVRSHHRYCKDWAIWPIAATKGGLFQEGDSHFSDLKTMAKKPSRKTRTAMLWILDATWRIADRRMSLGRTHTANQRTHRTATRHFQASMREDRRCRVRKEGEEI